MIFDVNAALLLSSTRNHEGDHMASGVRRTKRQ